MKIKSTVLSTIALLLCFNFFAQEIPKDEQIKKSSFIFEGKLLDIQTFKVADNDYMSCKINVIKNLNNDNSLKAGDIIELVTIVPEALGVLNTSEIYTKPISHPKPKSKQVGLEVRFSSHGVFFAERNTTISSGFSFTSITLVPTFSNSNAFFQIIPTSRYNVESKITDSTYAVNGFDKTFSTINLFNEYLNNLSVSFLSNHAQDVSIKKKDAFLTEDEKAIKKHNRLQYEKRVSRACFE